MMSTKASNQPDESPCIAIRGRFEFELFMLDMDYPQKSMSPVRHKWAVLYVGTNFLKASYSSTDKWEWAIHQQPFTPYISVALYEGTILET